MKKSIKCLAIIPARGGSKRIPGKNTKDFLGEPILQRVIKVVKSCKFFTDVMVSTDCQSIKSLAEKNDVLVPFLRSAKNSDDHAPLQDVVFEVLDFYKNKGILFDYICCVLPTAILISKERLQKAFDLLSSCDFSDGVIPIVSFSYPIWRSFKIENEFVKMNWPDNYLKRSQDLPIAYHDAGQFYLVKVDRFIAQKTFMLKNLSPLFISELESQDIDTIEDWKIAELKYQLLPQNNS